MRASGAFAFSSLASVLQKLLGSKVERIERWKTNNKCGDYLRSDDCFQFIMTKMLTNLLVAVFFSIQLKFMNNAMASWIHCEHRSTTLNWFQWCVLDNLYAQSNCWNWLRFGEEEEKNPLTSRRSAAIWRECEQAAIIMDLLMFIYWNIFLNILTGVFARARFFRIISI